MGNQYILDTNIILLMVKRSSFGAYFKKTYRAQPNVFLGYSYVSLGELDSLSQQNQWGSKRLSKLTQVLDSLQMIPISGQDLVDHYGRIDAYSQGKLPANPLPKGMSARNMGKNDLWIAATTAALGAALVTTDRDFDHLSPAFFAIDWVDIQQFRQ